MNKSHQRYLLTTFQYVDDLLVEAERVMASNGAGSLFKKYTQDATPAQRKGTHDNILRVREAMQQALVELKIDWRLPVSSAISASRTQVHFAGIALEEIDSKHMRGFGRLTEEEAQTLDRIIAELNTALARVRQYLTKDS